MCFMFPLLGTLDNETLNILRASPDIEYVWGRYHAHYDRSKKNRVGTGIIILNLLTEPTPRGVSRGEPAWQVEQPVS